MRLIRNATPALALVVLATTLVGCKAAPTLVGTWTTSVGGQNLEFNFKPDGSSEMTGSAGALKIKAIGTYKVDGEKFELTTNKVDIPGAPALVMAELKKKEGEKQTGTITFSSNDDVQLVMQNQNIALKRKK